MSFGTEVLINFVGDTSQLKPAEDVLEGIKNTSKETLEEWKKASTSIGASTKANNESSSKLAKSIDNIAKAAKSMDKSVIGGAYKQYLKEIQAALGMTNKELIVYIRNARTAAQQAIFEAQTDEEVKELTLSIEVMNQALVDLQAEEEKTETKFVSLRARLKEAKEELVKLLDAGITSGPAFEAAKKKAGDLDDQMRDLNATVKGVGSDTKNIDGLISLASGVAGGFAIAQGAAALFGGENDKVERALLKVNAAMAILQGLQQVQNVLQKESAASLLLQNGARTGQITTTVAATAATEGATVAQVELNTAMSLNPVGIFIIAITGLIAALAYFDDSAEKAEKAIENVGNAAEHAARQLESMQRVLQAGNDENIANLEKNNALASKITAQRIVGLKQQEAAELSFGRTLDAQYKTFRDRAAAGEFTKKDFEKQNEEFSKKQRENSIRIFDLRSQQTIALLELQKQGVEEYMKSQTAAAEQEVSLRKLDIINGQIDSIKAIQDVTDAEIKAIKKRRDEELATSALTAGERAKIEADADLKIAELKKAEQLKLLEIEKAGIEAKVLLARKGSEAEYNAKVEQLINERDIELAAQELTLQQKQKIDAEYKVKKRALDREFYEQGVQDEISFLTSYLEEFGLTEDRKLELTIRRLERQRDLEISQAEGNAAKIKEIYAKTEREILDIKIASINTVLSENLRSITIFSDSSIRAARKILEAGKSTPEQKVEALKTLQEFENNKLAIELSALYKKRDEKAITDAEYNLQYQDILNRQQDNEEKTQKAITQVHRDETGRRIELMKNVFSVLQAGLEATVENSALKAALTVAMDLFTKVKEILNSDISDGEKLIAIITNAVTVAQTAINQLFADASAKRQQALQDELQKIEEAKNRELSVKNLTEQQKADIEEKYRQRERVAKRQAFEADKRAKRSQALINGALAATLALATYAWPYNLVVAGITAGLVGLEIAEINREEPPGYKDGVIGYRGKGTTTSDSNPVNISDGESIINAKSTAKWREVLAAINNDNFEDLIPQLFREIFVPTFPEYNIPAAAPFNIDYEKMAEALAEKMPAPVTVNNTLDGEGLHSFVTTGNTVTEYKNKRYSIG